MQLVIGQLSRNVFVKQFLIAMQFGVSVMQFQCDCDAYVLCHAVQLQILFQCNALWLQCDCNAIALATQCIVIANALNTIMKLCDDNLIRL